jgi:hypothetical protein
MRLLLTPFLLALLLAVPACKKSPEEKGDAGVESSVLDVTAAPAEVAVSPKKKGRKKHRKKERTKAPRPEKAAEAAPKEAELPQAVAQPSSPMAVVDRADRELGEPAAGRAGGTPTPAEAQRPTPPAVVTPPPVKVAVARLLSVVDVNKALPEKGWIAYGPVQGIPPSETYNSLIYRKPGTNRFVTLLVWDFPQYTQALEKWHELKATYPNAEELKDMFAKSIFFSYRNQVSTLTALHEGSNAVVSVSCHSEVCDDTALYELAKTAYGRIQ